MANGKQMTKSLLKFVNDASIRTVGRTAVVLNKLLGRRAGDAPGSLTYHRIAPRIPGLPPPMHNVAPERFRQQITGLLARGFNAWPLRKLLDHHGQGRSVPRRTFAITFDDGYQCVYLNAWPVLRELRIPATVFVCTAFLDDSKPFPFDEWGMAYEDRAPADTFQPLTTAQCAEMQKDGLIELGAHTHTHQDFRNRPEAFREDLEASLDILRSRFAVENPTFAFPFGCPFKGYAADDLVAAAKATDVICGLTTESVVVDPASDPFRWGRFNVFSWDTGATLAAKLDGWYSWAPKLRKAPARSAASRAVSTPRRGTVTCNACKGGR
jgi:peptidoglycan/xylan/chitin deacetylase (PgdA/CDA1 family)